MKNWTNIESKVELVILSAGTTILVVLGSLSISTVAAVAIKGDVEIKMSSDPPRNWLTKSMLVSKSLPQEMGYCQGTRSDSTR